MDANKDELQRIKEILATLKSENDRLGEEASRAEKIAAIAQSDKSQIRTIQNDLIDSTATLLDIARQFETKRAPLIEQYRSLSAAIRRRTDTYQMQMTKLAKLKRQIQEGEVKLRDDEESITNLKDALENRGEQKPRSEYIDMIFQIIKTIEKQEQDVERIRIDIRAQHTQLNQTIEKVKRTWSLLDETIYSEAKRSNADWAKKTYKIVVELLTLFEGISESVEESGKLSAQMMELDTKIDRVETQVDTKALEKIESDLAEVRREIAKRS
jgi:chromosome segregation ATPase